ELGSAELTPQALEVLQTVVWTLQRWGARRVTATGYASSAGPKRLNRSLALARSEAVAGHLRTHSIDVVTAGEFRQTGQDAIERLVGLSRYHRVDVALRPNEEDAIGGPSPSPSLPPRAPAGPSGPAPTPVGQSLPASQDRKTSTSTAGSGSRSANPVFKTAGSTVGSQIKQVP
ncbi:MAG: hypothetical protein AAF449_20555, partial [Myxococcota bacterium]